jgi:hypothetical protein
MPISIDVKPRLNVSSGGTQGFSVVQPPQVMDTDGVWKPVRYINSYVVVGYDTYPTGEVNYDSPLYGWRKRRYVAPDTVPTLSGLNQIWDATPQQHPGDPVWPSKLGIKTNAGTPDDFGYYVEVWRSQTEAGTYTLVRGVSLPSPGNTQITVTAQRWYKVRLAYENEYGTGPGFSALSQPVFVATPNLA